MANMHTSLETGTVTSVEERPDGRVALLAMDLPDAGEEDCATCRMCYSKGGCERLLCAALNKDENIAEGTRVEVEIPHPSLYIPIVVTLLLPLMGIVAGGVTGLVLGSGHDARDLISALLALIGGIIFFVLGQKFFNVKNGPQKRQARIRRILQA